MAGYLTCVFVYEMGECENEASGDTMVNSLAFSLVTIHFVMVIYSLSLFTLSSLYKIQEKIEERQRKEDFSVEDAQKSLMEFKTFEHAFGPMYLMMFGYSQILWIYHLFSFFSSLLSIPSRHLFFGSFSAANLLVSISSFLDVALVAFRSHEVHRSLRKSIGLLNQLEKQTNIREEILDICHIREEIRFTGPLTALEIFNVNRGIVLRMLAVGLTYTFVLLKFKTGEN